MQDCGKQYGDFGKNKTNKQITATITTTTKNNLKIDLTNGPAILLLAI